MARRQYHIAFDTRNSAPAIEAVGVAITMDVITDPEYTFHVNLCEDPLYPKLVDYVNANPYREKGKKNG